MTQRKKLIAGNWKMHKTITESCALARDLKHRVGSVTQRDIVIAPTYPALFAVSQELRGSSIGLSAQEVFYEDEGAFTGAVSAPMLKDAGCRYVIVAHSERRALFGETLESSRLRLRHALKHDLTPIFCIGETLEQRESQQTHAILKQQLDAALEGLSAAELAKIVIAYEPVWAIGTGKVATPEQAQDAHHFIRQQIESRDAQVAAQMRILYGGSVKPNNAQDLLNQPDIDGALVGGASLDCESFVGIITAGMGTYEAWFDRQFEGKTDDND